MIKELCVFSGSAHRGLTDEICAILGISRSPSVSKHFYNDNLFVQLRKSVRERDVFIIQPFYPPRVSNRVLELFLMLDAARSASAGRVTAVIPYYSYSRSDKKDEPRISVAGRLIADLLAASGAQHVITMTLHSPQVQGFFGVPTDHLSSVRVFAEHFQEQDLTDAVVVTPDMGHVKRATRLARKLNLPIVAVNKKRINDRKVVVEGIIGDVRGEHAIIVDDEIAAGTSMVEALRELRKHGVRKATLVCTHGIFCGPAVQNLSSEPDIEAIVTTNTVPIAARKRIKSMKILSVAPLFADAIDRIHNGETMEPLFEY